MLDCPRDIISILKHKHYISILTIKDNWIKWKEYAKLQLVSMCFKCVIINKQLLFTKTRRLNELFDEK